MHSHGQTKEKAADELKIGPITLAGQRADQKGSAFLANCA
jgi:hypothetical protein